MEHSTSTKDGKTTKKTSVTLTGRPGGSYDPMIIYNNMCFATFDQGNGLQMCSGIQESIVVQILFSDHLNGSHMPTYPHL